MYVYLYICVPAYLHTCTPEYISPSLYRSLSLCLSLSLSIHIYIYIYTRMCRQQRLTASRAGLRAGPGAVRPASEESIYIYIYIYIERERGLEYKMAPICINVITQPHIS